MANVIEFVIQGTDKASGPIGKFSTKLGGLVKGVAAVGAALIAAGTAVVFFTSKIAASIDKQADFAGRLGVSVAQLTAYQFAAEVSGISTEQFNMATQRMVRRVAEAAQGLGEATGALAEMNINAQHFNTLDLDGQMQVLADRFAEVESPAERLRLAFKLFDSEGTAMLQMLGQGSEEMRRLTQDAEFLGLVVGPQMAANTAVFDEAMNRATGSVTGMSRSIANGLMPIIGGLANEFADFVAKNRDSVTNWVQGAIVSFFTLMEVGKQVFGTLAEAVDTFFTIDGFVDTLVAIPPMIIDFATWFVQTIAKVASTIGPILISGFKATFLAIGDIANIAAQEMFDVFTGNDLVDMGAEITAALKGHLQDLVSETKPMFEDFKTDAIDMGSSVADTLADVFGINVEQAQAAAEAMLESLSIFGDAAQDETGKATASARSFIEELALLNEEFLVQSGTLQQQLATGFFETMMQGVETVSAGIAQAIMTGGSLLDVLKNAGKMVLQSLLQMLIQIGIRHLLTSAIGIAAETSQATAELSSGIATAGVNAYASTAAIPIIGPALAPAAAAAAIGGASAAATAGIAAGKGMAVGVAHGGLDYVPSESTFLLDRGERVLSPRQNRDLTSFLSGQQGSDREQGVNEVLTVDGINPVDMYTGRQMRDLAKRVARARPGHIRFRRR